MDGTSASRIGIAAISTYEPPWILGNEWFAGTIPRKFVHHTGIESRPISLEDEVMMAVRAAKNLQRETGCDFQDCAGVIFASPSFVPRSVIHRHGDAQRLREEHLWRAARQLVRRLGIPARLVAGINWFCSGYSKALMIAQRRMAPRLNLGPDEHMLVITSSRISRITDFACSQTAALFGDLATATLLSRSDCQKYPVHFELLHADARKQPADGAYFDFHWRQNVVSPAEDGGQHHDEQRLVFSLNGMAIADAAPRAMSSAVAGALQATGIGADEVRYVVPHQAGTGIVRFTAQKIESLGIRGEVLNGLCTRTGNISSGSIPYALRAAWQRLHGVIACPTAAVGSPGQPEISQGCILLRATQLHERTSQVAA
jgi:3-oxoacyl-[acyl-carrier-protein] synthase III